MTIMKGVLTKHMEGMQRTFKNRHLTVGASEIGRCARMAWYVKKHPSAAVFEDESFGASHRGNMIEAHTVVPALQAAFGDKLLLAGKKQKTFVEGPLSATPDGLLVDLERKFLAGFDIPDIGPGRCILVEIKSIDPRIQLRSPKPEHARQANQQLGLVRSLTEWKPKYCLIMYVNASFMDDVVEFVVEFDQEMFERQKKRGAMILNAKTARELQPEGWIKGGKECDYCKFADACTELRTDVPAESGKKADPQFAAEIRELALEERDLDTKASEIAERQREIQIQIKDRLREKKLRGIKEADITVSWYPVKARITFDNEALRAGAAAANFALSPYEKVGTPGDGLRITLKGPPSATATKGVAPKAKLTAAKSAGAKTVKSK